MNNVTIVGLAHNPDQYIDVFVDLDPEDLKIYVFKENYCDALEQAIQQLNISLLFIDSETGEINAHTLIYFTDFIGVDSVLMLEHANKEKIKTIIINPN